MFKTRLTQAGAQPPNFAGHYRFTAWGCGSKCSAGAVIDLQTGRIIPPPLAMGTHGWDRWIYCGQAFDHEGVWTRAGSRLMIVRCGKTYIRGWNRVAPDTYYFVWDGSECKQIFRARGDETSLGYDNRPSREQSSGKKFSVRAGRGIAIDDQRYFVREERSSVRVCCGRAGRKWRPVREDDQ